MTNYRDYVVTVRLVVRGPNGSYAANKVEKLLDSLQTFGMLQPALGKEFDRIMDVRIEPGYEKPRGKEW